MLLTVYFLESVLRKEREYRVLNTWQLTQKWSAKDGRRDRRSSLKE